MNIMYIFLFSIIIILPGRCSIEQSVIDKEAVEEKEECAWIAKIKNEHLQSIHFEHGSWDEDDYQRYLERIITMRFNPEPHLLRSQACDFFIAGHRKTDYVDDVINDITTCRNLDLVCGSHQKETHLISKIARTKTELGLVTLVGMITEPTTNVMLLKRRQEVIQFFVDHPDVRESIANALEAIKKNEAIMLGFWGNWDPFKNIAQKQLFIKNLDVLNESTLMLEMKSIYEHHNRIWWTGAQCVAASVLVTHGILTLLSVDHSEKLKDKASQYGSGANAISALLWGLDNKWIHGLLSVFAGVVTSLYIEESYVWTKASFFLEECLQKILMSVAQYFHELRQIAEVCRQYPEIIAVMPELQRVAMLFDARRGVSAECIELLDLLTSDTFQGEPSIFSQKGNILRAYNLMTTIKDQFIGAIQSIGQLDVYTGLAQLYCEHQGKKNRYCFVEYSNNKIPNIIADRLWNPFLDADSAVANPVALSSQESVNLIATGPNAGGKSTYLKGIALALILAQSVGLAPAQSMSCTCFHRVATYMNVTDNIAQGQSLFKAEVERAQALISMMEGLAAEGKKGFVICDEMLSGTSPVEGEAAAYSLAKHLGRLPTICSVIATHFPLLTKLEQDTDSYRNVKVSVIKNSDGSIEYPFCVEPGIAHQHVAFDIMKLSGINGTIVNEASRIVEEISF